MSKTLLVDANNVAMRSFHAMVRTGLHSDDGVATGPLLGFINTLSKHVSEERPDRLVVAWDGGRSEFRLGLDPEYKAHRLSMEPGREDIKHSVFALAKEFCTLAGLHHVERPGFEADDVIGAYWSMREPGEQVVILSSDKDFLQLVEDGVEQVRLSSAGTATDRWDLDRVRQEMGCHAATLTYAMAIAGDNSDNVPGVPRFGMKTAVKALAKHDWDMVDLLINHERISPHSQRVLLNLDLVDLRRPLPGLALPALPLFEPTAPGGVMYPYLVSFLRRYQMSSILSRLNDGSLWS